ncbi:unnamed protein product [Arctogadus glacialis]
MRREKSLELRETGAQRDWSSERLELRETGAQRAGVRPFRLSRSGGPEAEAESLTQNQGDAGTSTPPDLHTPRPPHPQTSTPPDLQALYT